MRELSDSDFNYFMSKEKEEVVHDLWKVCNLVEDLKTQVQTYRASDKMGEMHVKKLKGDILQYKAIIGLLYKQLVENNIKPIIDNEENN